MVWARSMLTPGDTDRSTSARRACPIQRSRTRSTPTTPATPCSAATARSTSEGSTASIRRASTCLAAPQVTVTIAAVMARPTTGSAHLQPSAAPPADSSTASEVSASARACKPSATSAADPIRRPVRMRTWAAISLPAAPTRPAMATAPRNRTSVGSASLRTDS
jgi:hypothetical protein